MPARSSLALAEGVDGGRDPRGGLRPWKTEPFSELAQGPPAAKGEAKESTVPESISRPDLGRGKPRLRLNVRLPGQPDSISPLVERAMQLLSDTGGLAGREFAIETALREALANAIRHGCGNDASKFVECSVVCRASGEVTIVVRDPGPGFDPATIPNPVCAENLYCCHGRGIYLIRQLMDEVWFARGGTEIHMRKR
jgi:serine/threonine-protein kinase RsbW